MLKLKKPDRAAYEASVALALLAEAVSDDAATGKRGSEKEWRPDGGAWAAGVLAKRAVALRQMGRAKEALQVGLPAFCTRSCLCRVGSDVCLAFVPEK